MEKVNKYILEITVFICGAVVMIYELVGSRILGPYFGTSIFIWTSLIGIILGSLSLGYYLGGKIADKKANLNGLSLIVFLSAISIGTTFILKYFLFDVIQLIFQDARWASFFAALILFSPASIFLGIISPYAAKLKMNDLNTSGSTIGNLYAISTAGSIIGTFLSGFYLIPHFGTNKLLLILLTTLIILSLMISVDKFTKLKLSLFMISIMSWFMLDFFYYTMKSEFVDVDTAYNRIWIYNRLEKKTNKVVKMMGINNENQSSMYLTDDELVSDYTKYYHLAKYFKPDFKDTLMFGGAGYSFPKSFLLTYPDAKIDVIEIDPKVTELARKYFRLEDNPRLSIFHEDGRVYLNKSKKKYDIIFGDAFGSRYSIPYQLTTKEATQRKFDILNDDGVVILNTIAAIEGEKGQFLQAEYATYKSIFPQVYLFPVRNQNGTETQNVMLIALKSKEVPSFVSDNEEYNRLLQTKWQKDVETNMPILTDDFAPVDYYTNKAI